MNLNRIYLQNCYEGMREIPDGSVDLVVTDPPYNTTDCSWDKPIDIPLLFDELLRVCKENAAIVIFSQLPFSVDLINARRKLFRYEWIWEKSCACGFLNAKKMPLRAHENILVFYRKLPTYNPQKIYLTPYKKTKKIVRTDDDCVYKIKERKIQHQSNGERFPRSVQYFLSAFNEVVYEGSGKFQKSFHSTAKPRLLIEYLIKTYSNEGELVLDPFAGSGTTAVAALSTNRKYICFEQESKYVEVAEDRIRKFHETPKQTALVL